MKPVPFRLHHLYALLESYSNQRLPLDLFMSHYFRANKSLGSKDRAFIAETAYSLIRWQGLLDYLYPESPSWAQRYETYINMDLNEIIKREDIPPHIRVSFPKVLFDQIDAAYGMEKAIELCVISNNPAPTTIRVNTNKISREALFERWKDSYDISCSIHAPEGIAFNKRINFFDLPEYKEGFFEVQDEGSQLLAKCVDAKPGDQVMDFCAGSGGKTLAFAVQMKNQGQIYLHDIRVHALQEAKKRLKRAGIQNAQMILSDSPNLAKLKKKMNWVLVDAPCSGTGTLRRNPDMKWRFDEKTLPDLIGQQKTIFERALSFLRPDGRIVYATCSILPEENEKQVDYFIKTYNLTLEGTPYKTLPSHGGMDGFFGVVLKKS